MNQITSESSNLAVSMESLVAQEAIDTAVRDLVDTLKLLADENRVRILQLLKKNGELNVRSLSDQLAQSQPAVSHHLALLRTAGLIRLRRDGKHNFYRVVPDKLTDMFDWARAEMANTVGV